MVIFVLKLIFYLLRKDTQKDFKNEFRKKFDKHFPDDKHQAIVCSLENVVLSEFCQRLNTMSKFGKFVYVLSGKNSSFLYHRNYHDFFLYICQTLPSGFTLCEKDRRN
ncbi:hypothetical protein BpHYR1_032519 [Brachionus plicatilis]|uniref:Uncharacterized protein n=1 Tax=Brachionus plicatilis TaxID=10195 RepID=A0A3M7Q5F7_BRAPC|nr:hypothetical protein BpHYR1_032519 [Brachionus plicatilis]